MIFVAIIFHYFLHFFCLTLVASANYLHCAAAFTAEALLQFVCHLSAVAAAAAAASVVAATCLQLPLLRMQRKLASASADDKLQQQQQQQQQLQLHFSFTLQRKLLPTL